MRGRLVRLFLDWTSTCSGALLLGLGLGAGKAMRLIDLLVEIAITDIHADLSTFRMHTYAVYISHY